MITVKEVKTKKDAKAFIEFPLRLYKKCPYFVPPLYGDEKKLILGPAETEQIRSVFFLAEQDGLVVGRIQGLIQKQYNQIHGCAKARFTRFDSIDDAAVSSALFGAVEAWAREQGMRELCGPLGANDLEREGLLIEGFDQNSTFEEQYNYEYYGKLVEQAGFAKDVDWLEFELRAPRERNQMLSRVAQRALELNHLHVASTDMPKRAYIEKYGDSFFDCLDECYAKLYGTVPLTAEQRREIIGQFLLVVNIRYAVFICDESDRVVAFGLCFPGFGDALKKSGGRMTPAALLRLLRAVKHPSVMDLALVAVRPEYQSSGVNAVLIDGLVDMLARGEVEKCETNLNLETNHAVLAQWKYFDARQHKRRRSYIKSIESEILQ